ncbi:MAG: hypothetical protein ACIALR_13445, partial [Blastopirellula sp. JB062]
MTFMGQSVLFVFLCGIMLANLVIGFGLAIYLRQFTDGDEAMMALDSPTDLLECDAARELSCETANAPATASVRARAIASIDVIPPEYIEMLQGE